MNFEYCNSLTSYSRFETREVKIGSIGIGGKNPIRVQSMTTTDTMNTLATVEQSIRMIEAGCELVRITAPSLNEAKNLEKIKNEIRNRGYQTPIVADIHFTPNAAEWAARIVEKVRVNPGNYADKKKFELIDYSNESYDAELERIRTRFTPLVKICKEYGTAMRIGTNHGSLSDRIMSRYGDTALGMVESALEFLRIAEENNFYNIVLSMKSSNTQVMVEAYRLLVNKMIANGMAYPLHLGVTEAGEGEDGRIKSAVGIGTLLEDGLGDTIRVSLTEEPEFEIPIALELANRYSRKNKDTEIIEFNNSEISRINSIYNPFEYKKRETIAVQNFGGDNVPRVIADFSSNKTISPATFFTSGYSYSIPLDKWSIADMACDFAYIGDKQIDFEIPGMLGIIQDNKAWNHSKERHFPLFFAKEFFDSSSISSELNFVVVNFETFTSDFIQKIKNYKSVILIFECELKQSYLINRSMFFKALLNQLRIPIIIKNHYQSLSENQLQLFSSTDFGGLLLDGFGDGIWVKTIECGSPESNNRLMFGILQAARTRISKTEYISCPSCGRTLFDLQETTAKIRSKTSHLKGIKIGIMGCIVNGPGEMADADYGYVGVGVDKITLYKGKEVVKKNVPSNEAVESLIELIKENGDWVEIGLI